MRSRLAHACAVVLLGIGASPVMSQTADTTMTQRGGPVLAPVDSMIHPVAPVVPSGFESRDSVSVPDSVSALAPDSERIATLAFMVQKFDAVRVVTSGASQLLLDNYYWVDDKYNAQSWLFFALAILVLFAYSRPFSVPRLKAWLEGKPEPKGYIKPLEPTFGKPDPSLPPPEQPSRGAHA